MIILRVLNLEGFSEQNILFSVVLFDKKITQKLLRLVLIYVLEWHEWSDGQKEQWHKLWQGLLPAGGIRMIVQCEHCLTAYRVLPENSNRGVSEWFSLTAFLEHRKSKSM